MIKVRSCVDLLDRKNYVCNQHEQLKSANILFQREAEKETPEDLKQAFRVFDKVSLTLKSFFIFTARSHKRIFVKGGSGFVHSKVSNFTEVL